MRGVYKMRKIVDIENSKKDVGDMTIEVRHVIMECGHRKRTATTWIDSERWGRGWRGIGEATRCLQCGEINGATGEQKDGPS